MEHVIGIDAGGTKTVCLLANEHGEILARARGEGANLQAVGELQVEKILHTVMAQAIGDRRIVPAAICLGIAGVDRPHDNAIIRGIMRRIGLKAPVLVVNDALVALVAGAGDEGPGIVLIAGTGSICYGRNAAGQAARAGGWGYLLGDEGSGWWIGREALTVTTSAAIDFMRKPAPGGLVAEARVLKLGRSLSVGDVLIFSEGVEGPVARASLTYAIPPGGEPRSGR